MGVETKWFSSTMAGAPVLSGTIGAFNALLDAVLVNGFNLVTINSIVVSGGIATASVTTGHGYFADRVVLVAGALPAQLNGEKKILSIVSNNIFTFDATGVADQIATGTMTAKVSPLGWQRTSVAGSISNYRSNDPMGSRYLLSVHDSVTTYSLVNGFERTGAAGGPISGGLTVNFLRWNKSNTADATARPWSIFGDSRGFYFCVASNNISSHAVYFFGDPVSRKSGDMFGCLMTGAYLESTSSTSVVENCLGVSSRSVIAGYFSRALGAVRAGPVTAFLVGAGHTGITSPAYSGTTGYSLVNSPNAADNSRLIAPVNIITGGSLRGHLPGFYHAVTIGEIGVAMPRITQGPLVGRRLVPVGVGPAGLGNSGTVHFDVTGPWR